MKKPENSGKPFGNLESHEIKDMMARGLDNHTIAKKVGRTADAIAKFRSRWKKEDYEMFMKMTGGKQSKRVYPEKQVVLEEPKMEETKEPKSTPLNHNKSFSETDKLIIKYLISQNYNNYEVGEIVGRDGKAISNFRTRWKKEDPKAFEIATGNKNSKRVYKNNQEKLDFLPKYEDVLASVMGEEKVDETVETPVMETPVMETPVMETPVMETPVTANIQKQVLGMIEFDEISIRLANGNETTIKNGKLNLSTLISELS